MCKVQGDRSRYESTHELSYVVRENLWTGKKTTCKREGYGRFKRISSGTSEAGEMRIASQGVGEPRSKPRGLSSEQKRAEF